MKTELIALVASTFESAMQAKIFALVKARLQPGQNLQLLSVGGDPDVQKGHLLMLLQKSRPAALIALSVSPDGATVAAYKAAGAPVVLIDEEAPGAATITTDNLRGGWLAADFLAKKGRKRIAVVSGRPTAKGGYNARLRVDGVKAALSAHKLTIPEGCLIEVLHYSSNDGVESMARLLNENRGVDAIFCAAGDVCAGGLVKEARRRGVKIPAEIAIVGFDDMDIAQIITPPLTTIRQPLQEMADAAYRMAVVERAATLKNPRSVVFQPTVVEREST